MEEVLISEVADVFRGIELDTDLYVKDGNVKAISNIDLQEFGINTIKNSFNGLGYNNISVKRAYIKYLVEENDVLIIARGGTSSFRAVIFEKRPDICIVINSIIVIRPDLTRLNSVYLKTFLETDIGKERILNTQTNPKAKNLNLNISHINEKFKIPLPPIDFQNEFAEKYLKEFKSYRQQMFEIQNNWKTELDGLTKKYLGEFL